MLGVALVSAAVAAAPAYAAIAQT
ncbi:hypothetical protein JCM5296_000103, partial [Sporobolomyces johnsonii]